MMWCGTYGGHVFDKQDAVCNFFTLRVLPGCVHTKLDTVLPQLDCSSWTGTKS